MIKTKNSIYCYTLFPAKLLTKAALAWTITRKEKGSNKSE